MSKVNVYYSSMPSVQYVFKDGTVAGFIAGVFSTSIPTQVEELNAEVAARHPIITVKVGYEVVDSADLDPLAELKKQVIANYLAEQAANAAKDKDMGNSTPLANLGMANSSTINDAASGSSSGMDVAGMIAAAKASS
jgi:hypothetical protein